MKFVLRHGCWLILVALTGCVSTAVGPREEGRAQPLFHSVAGLAKVRVETGEERFGGTHALFVKSPNKLRAELYGFFGRPVYLLVSDGESITCWFPGENRYISTSATPLNFFRLTRIPLDGTDFINLLLGRLPSLPGAETETVYRDNERRVERSATEPEFRRDLQFDQYNRLVAGGLWHREDEVLRVEYADFSAEDFPGRIRLSFPVIGTSAEIEFEDPVVDTEIPPERFKLEIPAEARRVEMENM